MTDDLGRYHRESVLARIADLRAAWAEATGDNPDDYVLSGDDYIVGLGTDEAEELVALIDLAESWKEPDDR